MSKDDRIDLAKWTIDRALKHGADQAAVSISNQRDVEVEFRDKKLETLKESTQNSLSLKIYTENKYSSHSTNDMRKETLEKFISEAVASTKYLTKDEFRSLPDPKFFPKKLDIDLDILDKAYQKIEPNSRVKMASDIEKATLAQSDKIISATTGYSDTWYETIKVLSNGFVGKSQGTFFSAGAEATVNDPSGGRPSDWCWAVTRYFNELPAPEFYAKIAVANALAKIGQNKIDSGKYTMLVENRASGQLMGMLQGPLTARALQQKSSYLEGMIGKKIASDKLTVIDNPFVKRGLGSRLFDSEGLTTEKRVIIEKGILKEYLIDDYYGKKLGLDPNSGSTSNIVFEQSDKSLADMIKSVKKGIVVTGFIGGNNNPTTGDFSYGIVGLLVENGEIVKPVNEMNISGNGMEFWQQLALVGNDPYMYSSVQSPALLFEDVNFSGI